MSNTKLCESCEDPNQTQHEINVNKQTTTSLQQTMERYLEDKKKLYDIIYEYLDNSDENNEYDNRTDYFHTITEILNEQENFREEMEQFLQIVKSISDNHHRNPTFINKIKNILEHYSDQMKQTFTNTELFQIFENNKILVLFLLKKEIITISKTIYEEMMNKFEFNNNRYCYFFYPELEKFAGKESMKIVQKELLQINENIFENYEDKRNEGENDSYICSLIRQDSVEKFISYMNRNNFSLSSEIFPSIFETNSFLIENKNTTLIEYAAFFGSFQIFQYLLFNKVEVTPSLWFYSIHSKNSEMIHYLESNKVPTPTFKYDDDNDYEEEKEEEECNTNNNYILCLTESIKCHHNDITEYFINNFIDDNEKDSKQKEEIISKIIKYHNYKYFQIDDIVEHGFFYLNHCNYYTLVKLLLKNKEKVIESKLIQ